ncbi:MAG: alpha/beta fold hydrolase [Flavobacteriaceae bacterium]|nr:alpha/beta fold hydrolase [Flavobacteriaceae bacterium]
MPIIKSDYKPTYIFRNGFFSTIYASKIRNETNFFQQRERINLPDEDFIDLDWSYAEKPTNKLVILLHGLEGNAQRTYIKGMGRALKNNGRDTVAMNFRGCSGEDNLLYQSYHSGKTDDLIEVISHILEKDNYQEITIVGFSLGGNLLLKYLGEQTSLPKQIKKGVAISVPSNLKGSIETLMSPSNWMYSEIFLSNLKKKYKRKMKQHPDKMNMSDFAKIKTLKDFDDIYTSKAHGFKDAYDYYEKNSSNQFIPNIKIPVLILNAKNDSFLNEDCYPYQTAENSKNIYLETPLYGGHVGFHQTNEVYYSEKRTLEFLK